MKDLDIEVHMATLQDVSTIATIEQLAIPYENRSDEWQPDFKMLHRLWSDRIKSKIHRVIVASIIYNNKKFKVGFLSLEYDLKAGYIHTLYVAPKYFGLGIGKALVKAACYLIKNAGGNMALLTVQPRNANAINFYTSQGFTSSQHQFKKGLITLYREL